MLHSKNLSSLFPNSHWPVRPLLPLQFLPPAIIEIYNHRSSAAVCRLADVGACFTEKLHKYISERCVATGRVPLCINPQSTAFKSFARWVERFHSRPREFYLQYYTILYRTHHNQPVDDTNLCFFFLFFCSSCSIRIFCSSTVAHPSELPPSPHQWD